MSDETSAERDQTGSSEEAFSDLRTRSRALASVLSASVTALSARRLSTFAALEADHAADVA
jgi:hypothetical protein